MTPARPLQSLGKHALLPLHCRYEGRQQGFQAIAGFDLYTILDRRGIPGHPFGSTVALPTLTEAGYWPVTRKGTPP